jgi:hypothetical protein
MNQLTHASPVSDVTPCDDSFPGRLLMDFCRDCNHAIAVHRQDHVCSVCEAVATVRVDLAQLYRDVRQLKGEDPDAPS